MFKSFSIRFFTTKHTTNQVQMEKFNELSKVWWDEDNIALGIFHALNRLRLSWIINQLTEIGTIQTSHSKTTPLTGLSVLDVGCGGGILAEPLSRLGGNIRGIDCNPDMLKVATSHLQDKTISNLQYILTTIEEHAVDNKNKYDVVIASETVEHVDAQEFFLKCCVECLKPGGSIFITTNSYLPKGTHTYNKFIDIEEVKTLLKKEQCKIVFSGGIIYNLLCASGTGLKIPTFFTMDYMQ